MHTPPSSSELFFPSSPEQVEFGPSEEVEALYMAAKNVSALNNHLTNAIIKNKDLFLHMFGRQVQLVKSRSQAFEDAHITVYDKVLLLLTHNGNDLESPAAIAWYCAEYLGLNPEGKAEDNVRSTEEAMALHKALSPAAASLLSHKKSNPSALTNSHSSTTTKIASISKEDPKFKHLWSVYSKAHADYLELARRKDNKHDTRTLEAAKFLRDTAENGVHYLRDKFPHDPVLTELTKTYNMAKLVVLDLNGGKKRKFDAGPGHEGSHKKNPVVPHTVTHDRVYAARRHQKSAHKKEKARGRGRGQNPVPYGYTRPVDSYYPA